MALLEFRRDPSPTELRWFGLVTWPLFLVVAWLLHRQAGWTKVALGLAGFATLLLILYTLLPPVRRLCYVGWMTLVFPLGWVVSHLLLGVVYYLCVTPIGVVRRMLGRDGLDRRRPTAGGSSWHARPPAPPARRYFRQF